MIGNDIVDLARAKQESNWRRRGFLEKVFTNHEQQLIHEVPDPDSMVWLLWSMKESAYKLSVQHTSNRVYAPKKIACFLDELTQETQTGRVVYETVTYETTSVLTAAYIATVAVTTGTAPIYTHGIVPFDNPSYSIQQHTVREHIKRDSAAWLGVSEHSIAINKNKAGVPELTVGNSFTVPITISHHGHYGAYGIPSTVLNPCKFVKNHLHNPFFQ